MILIIFYPSVHILHYNLDSKNTSEITNSNSNKGQESTTVVLRGCDISVRMAIESHGAVGYLKKKHPSPKRDQLSRFSCTNTCRQILKCFQGKPRNLNSVFLDENSVYNVGIR